MDEAATQRRLPGAGLAAGTRAGRFALSLGLVALLASVLVWNLPQENRLRQDLVPTVRPVVNALGLNQRWELFSPNPSRVSVGVHAVVRFADGSETVYELPDGEPFVGALREYRWRKLERRIRLDSRRDLWRPTARWIAGRFDDDPAVVSVTLVRRFSTTPEPGTDDPRVWEESEFYTLDLRGDP